MSFLVIGLNHRTAPVEVREKIVFAGADLPKALVSLRAVPGVRECVILSTCNRTELYCYTAAGDEPLMQWLAHWHGLDPQQLHGIGERLYRLNGNRAVAHMFSVACGLDSMILGEPQVLGQLKEAYRAALHHEVTGAYLNRLFQTAFSVAKRVRTETRIGANAVSAASAAVALARTVFDRFEDRTALMVGAGETVELAARHLHAQGVRRMIIANRNLDRAQQLANEFNGFAITLDSLEVHLPEADILISSTASPQPLITYDAVRRALRARKRRPIFMVDLAVPRDIDPKVSTLEDIYLFTIDDLQNVISENLESRRQAARDADQLIAAQVARFELQLRTLNAVPTIRQLRSEADSVKTQTMRQAQRMLAAGRDPNEVVEFLATTLTNRLMHSPSQRLRDAAENDEIDLFDAARELFALGEPQTPDPSCDVLDFATLSKNRAAGKD